MPGKKANLSKYDKIEDKMEKCKSMDFLNWPPRRVTEHLIAAGRMRLMDGKLYDFPGYVRFPYELYIGNWFKADGTINLDILPFKYSDDDSLWKVTCLAHGKMAYYEMRTEHHAYVEQMLKKHFCVAVPLAGPKRKGRANEHTVGQQEPEPAATADTDYTPSNFQLMQNSNVQVSIENAHAFTEGDGSQHISHALEQSTPLAQSTPLRPATHATTSHASNLTPIADYNDDVADELFDQDGAAVSTSFREGLVGIQTNMDPNVSQHLLRIGVSLDRDEVDRIQPVQPDPNEIRPIRRHRPRVNTRRQPDLEVDEERPGRFLHADADATVNIIQVFNMSIIEENLPSFVDNDNREQVPIGQNTASVVPQIDLDDNIEIQVAPPAVPVENRTNEERTSQQQQQQQQSTNSIQLNPQATSTSALVPQQHGQTAVGNQQVPTASLNQNQPNSEAATKIRAKDRLYKRAISRLGRSRAPSKTRKLVAINKAAFDLNNLEVERKPEASYHFHPYLEPGPDLTEFFERIFELLCVDDYVRIGDYIQYGWDQFQRSCALSALTELASDGYIKIRTDSSGIKGFEIFTIDVHSDLSQIRV